MKNTYNKFDKNINNNNSQKNVTREDARDYSYYSRVLGKPFDSLDELREAEATYFAEQRAKADKAAAKKTDAKKVEDAFKALNAARKAYKENLLAITERYSEDLKELKAAFEASRDSEKKLLALAEEAYASALKTFTEKYPEGYHLTLKDGDFETTISGHASHKEDFSTITDLFNWIFG